MHGLVDTWAHDLSGLFIWLFELPVKHRGHEHDSKEASDCQQVSIYSESRIRH